MRTTVIQRFIDAVCMVRAGTRAKEHWLTIYLLEVKEVKSSLALFIHSAHKDEVNIRGGMTCCMVCGMWIEQCTRIIVVTFLKHTAIIPINFISIDQMLTSCIIQILQILILQSWLMMPNDTSMWDPSHTPINIVMSGVVIIPKVRISI